MSKILVSGDTHNDKELRKKFNSFKDKKYNENDVIILTGDVGAITWDNSRSTNYSRDYLASKKFTTAIVLGNHDNYDLVRKLPVEEKWGNRVRVIKTNYKDIYILERGETYTINGKKILTISGASSIDKVNRIPELSWWSDEVPTKREMEHIIENLINNIEFDYVFTHTAPTEIAGQIVEDKLNNIYYYCPVSEFLSIIKKHIKFKKWYFGHFHTNWESEDNKFICNYDRILEVS